MIRGPVELLAALERECLEVDKAIAACNWEGCEISWRSQRRLTHELDIALRERPLAEEEAAKLRKRIERLTRYRNGQLKRLQAFNEACAAQLATMGKFKAFSRTVGKERRSSVLDVQY